MAKGLFAQNAQRQKKQGKPGALANGTKQKKQKKPKQPKPNKPSTPSSSTPGGTPLTTYKPPAITDEMLAKSPQQVSPGKYKDSITGLDVNVDFGPNPFNPGGATAQATSTPASKPKAQQPTRKLPGKGKKKKGTVPLVFGSPKGPVTRYVGPNRAREIIRKRARRRNFITGVGGSGLSAKTKKQQKPDSTPLSGADNLPNIPLPQAPPLPNYPLSAQTASARRKKRRKRNG